MSDSFLSCMNIENDAVGVWYKFQGTDSPILVSTVLVDTCIAMETYETSNFVSVFQGSTCGLLVCLPTYYYQPLFCGDTYRGSSIAITESRRDVTYYVHISNRYESFSSQFSSSLSAYMKYNNDHCSKAKEIAVDGAPVRGTIHRSVSNKDIPFDACDSLTLYGVDGGAWYRLSSTKNATLRASTCSNGTAAMFTGLVVVRDDCDGRTCLANSNIYDSVCEYGGSLVDFEVVGDSNYYVVVVGSISGDIGFFELDIRSLNPPDNDDCEASDRLFVDGPNVTGTLFESTASVHEKNLSLSFVGENGGGVWYSFTGTGDNVIASSCSDMSPHRISIYQGECGGFMKCLSYSSSVTPPHGCTHGGKTMSLQTIEGTTYFVLVSYYVAIQSRWTFNLSIRKVAPPINSKCWAAIEVIPDDNTRVVGNTMDAMYYEAPMCGFGYQSRGLWYRVRGTGDMMRADTCSTRSNYTASRISIAIFEGPCGVKNSSCLASNRAQYESGSSSVTWPTKRGVDYYIHVSGGDLFDEFDLRVYIYKTAPNNECSGAIRLMTGLTLSASMNGAYPKTSDSTSAGIWYYVEGHGSAIAISTCDPAGNGAFSGDIQVFQDLRSGLGWNGRSGCSSRLRDTMFLYGKDCSSSSTASVKFFAEKGERYYVLFLSSFATGCDYTNNFAITVTNIETAPNDVCEGAFRLDQSIRSIIGSTRDSLPANKTCYDGAGSAGAWYAVHGTGRPMMASTCSSELTMDTTIGVSSGNCDQLTCVAYASSQYCEESTFESAGVVFNTEADVTYYLLVSGMYSQSSGNFGLTISDVETPWNDLCTNATVIVPDTGTIVGSTLTATMSKVFSGTKLHVDNGPCAYHSDYPGVWYSLNGTGHGHIISVSHSASFILFSGGCRRLQCLASTHDTPSFSIGTKIGVEYLILVRSAGADFDLTVSSYDLEPNDICSGAITIVPGKGTINGSTYGASDSGTRCNPFNFDAIIPRSPDLWYRIDGTGKTLIASIECDYSGRYFDTSIEVFESADGTCTMLSCVASGYLTIHEDFGCNENSPARWSATLGKTYFIRVFGGPFFELSVD